MIFVAYAWIFVKYAVPLCHQTLQTLSNMNTRTYLLPHRYQQLGWWLFAAPFVCVLPYMAMSSDEALQSEKLNIIATLVFTCLPYLGVGLICLSQEKQEDEYIQSLRARALFAVVVYAFIVNMVSDSLARFLMQSISLDNYGFLRTVIYAFTNTPFLAVIYLVLFKGSLVINRIRTRHVG